MDANYIVMVVVLIIWAGVFFYVWSVDRKLKVLEKRDES
jgi:CcmD family protein